MRVLVVEDDHQLAEVVVRGLRRVGLAVDHAADGEAALDKLTYNEYQVVVLDRDLPAVHGDQVCRRLVADQHPARILMLTASGTLDERVEGLMLGADDYLAKPFAMRELVARIQALARRTGRAAGAVLDRGELRVDTGTRAVERAGRAIELARKEFGVLEELLRADGQVVSSEDLLERVWDEHIDPFTNAVRITVMTLRRKLGPPDLIETVVGVGYRIAKLPPAERPQRQVG
jgi:DNA-binding response OmpR family regulator